MIKLKAMPCWVCSRISAPKDIRDRVVIKHNNAWYFHGTLEDELDYDLGYFYDLPQNVLRSTADWTTIRRDYRLQKRIGTMRPNSEPYFEPYLNGMYEVEVYGSSKKCLGFFWTTDEEEVEFDNGKSYPVWSQKGLVFHSDDCAAFEYALDLFIKKSQLL